MRDFFYQLSWDKELRQKFLSRSAIGAFAFSLVLAICVVGFGNFNKPELPDDQFRQEETEDGYVLEFGEIRTDKNQPSEETHTDESKQSNSSESSGSGENPGGGGGGGGDQPQHVHSWFVVIDSDPWDEEVWVQTGTKYICNACGFVCYDTGSASAHSNQTGHKFRSEGVFEKRWIHHDGTSHQECSCGARR